MDPRRLQWISETILAMRLDETRASSFGEARKLLLQRALLSTASWRRADWALMVRPSPCRRCQRRAASLWAPSLTDRTRASLVICSSWTKRLLRLRTRTSKCAISSVWSCTRPCRRSSTRRTLPRSSFRRAPRRWSTTCAQCSVRVVRCAQCQA